jgi:DNA polymerase-4
LDGFGIKTDLDLRNQTPAFLEANFGKSGTYYYWISRGIDERPVRSNRIRKSIGAENTFFNDLTEFNVMVAELQLLVDKVWRHCESTGNRGRTVTLKIKFADFEIMSRSQSLPGTVSDRAELERVSVALLENSMPLPKAVRLLGVSLSALQAEARDKPQMTLLLQVRKRTRL